MRVSRGVAMNLEHASPRVDFDSLSCACKTRMYCRNIVRLIIRFPIFLITFLVLSILLLSLQEPHEAPRTAPTTKSYIIRNARADRELVEGLLLCPLLKRPNQSSIRTLSGHWQHHGSVETEEIIVNSAFFDDRPLVGVSTWIRVLGMATNFTSDGLYCHLWYDDQPNPYVTQAVLDVTGRKKGYRLEKKVFIQYLFSCRLTSAHPLPSHVSLVWNQCDNSSILLPVHRPLRTSPEHEFGVCVPVAFGTIPVQQFVEWIELLHLFGVTEFNVYDSNMTGMTEVFDFYVNRGWLKVFQSPPALNMTGIDGPKFGSAAALNDCMMRNLYRYRLLLVIDFDEAIIPRMHRNYSAMLAYVDSVNNAKEMAIGYGFRNAFFFRDLKPDPKQPSHLWTMVHRTRSEVAKYRTAPKSFVDPLQCLSVFNHYCYLPLKPIARPVFINVQPTVAVTHHYRLCGFPKAKCKEYFDSSYEDDTALRFKGDLEPRVKVTLEHLEELRRKKQQQRQLATQKVTRDVKIFNIF